MRYFWMAVGVVALWYLIRGTVKRFLTPNVRPRVDRPRDDERRASAGTTPGPKGFSERDDIRDANYRDL